MSTKSETFEAPTIFHISNIKINKYKYYITDIN